MVSPSFNSRRTASPVRLSMVATLGGDIDGAWWPRTGSMVRELPDLVEALRPALGEVVDISLNWSAASATPLMGAMPAKSGPCHRLMAFVGRTAATTILVVPAVTPAGLAMMVLRQAGKRPISVADKALPVYDKADRILRAARVESGAWEAERAGR